MWGVILSRNKSVFVHDDDVDIHILRCDTGNRLVFTIDDNDMIDLLTRGLSGTLFVRTFRKHKFIKCVEDFQSRKEGKYGA